jgi:hypothetical protein
MSRPNPQLSTPSDDSVEILRQSERCGMRCCGLARLVVPALLAAAVFAIPAAYLLGRGQSVSSASESVRWNLPQIDATASASSEKFSIATGMVSDDVEGLYVLDHNSGLLQCNVFYPRMHRIMASFSGNVATDLGTGGKGGQYIMVTGHADFPRASNRPSSSSVLYVLDTATGNYACYGVPFDRVAMNANRPQQGVIALLATGTGNPLVDRDALR